MRNAKLVIAVAKSPDIFRTLGDFHSVPENFNVPSSLKTLPYSHVVLYYLCKPRTTKERSEKWRSLPIVK
jgi:hypothetical protein